MDDPISIDAANRNSPGFSPGLAQAPSTGTAYAPGDPRQVLAPLQSAYDEAQAAASQPIPEAPVRPADGFTNSTDASTYANAMRAHNQALRDATAYADHAKYLHDTLHAATIKADAGDFHNDFAHVAMDDPNLQDKAAALLAKHPGAASDPSVIHSLDMKLNANAKHLAINESNQKQEEAYQEKASKLVADAKAEGTLTDNDVPAWDGKGAIPKAYQRNPRTGNLVYNMDYLQQTAAANRAAGMGTKAESAEMTAARNTQSMMAKMLAANPDDPNAALYQQAHDEAARTIAQGTIDAAKKRPAGAAAAAAVAVTPRKPAASYVP